MRKETEKFRDERLTIIQIGSVTLVGVNTSSYPVPHGNCFDVICDDGKNYRISNFSYENYVEVTKRLELSDVKVLKIGERNAIIADERIPREWYDQRWCSICTPMDLLPPQQQLEDKLDELRGDKTYIDSPIGTLVSYNIEAKERKLDPKWTIEIEEDVTEIDPSVDTELVSILSEQILKDMEEEGLIPPKTIELSDEERERGCMDGFIYAPYIPKALQEPREEEND